MPPLFQPDEPNWQDHRQINISRLPKHERCRLLDSGSLTARLVAASSEFHVQVLGQAWLRPRPSERQSLNMAIRDIALVREVALICDGNARVFARSVLPARSLTGRLRFLRRFGSQSLGAMLYRDPYLRRTAFELSYNKADAFRIPYSVYAGEKDCWGRRSIFTLQQKPLLVSEIFLPSALELRL